MGDPRGISQSHYPPNYGPIPRAQVTPNTFPVRPQFHPPQFYPQQIQQGYNRMPMVTNQAHTVYANVQYQQHPNYQPTRPQIQHQPHFTNFQQHDPQMHQQQQQQQQWVPVHQPHMQQTQMSQHNMQTQQNMNHQYMMQQQQLVVRPATPYQGHSTISQIPSHAPQQQPQPQQSHLMHYKPQPPQQTSTVQSTILPDSSKREKKKLMIVDPSTGKELELERVQPTQVSLSESETASKSDSNQNHVNHSEIPPRAREPSESMAAQVEKQLPHSGRSSESLSTQLDNHVDNSRRSSESMSVQVEKQSMAAQVERQLSQSRRTSESVSPLPSDKQKSPPRQTETMGAQVEKQLVSIVKAENMSVDKYSKSTPDASPLPLVDNVSPVPVAVEVKEEPRVVEVPALEPVVTNSPEEMTKTIKKPEEKLRYDRDTLLKLQNSMLSLKRPKMPDNLPELIRADQERDFFMPGYLNQDKGNRQMNNKPQYPHRPQMTQGRQQQHQQMAQNQRMNGRHHQKVIIDAREPSAELKRSESAYVPSFRSQPGNNKNKELRRKILTILNKIAPQNFKSCLEELSKIGIDKSKSDLETCIETLFDKAVKEEAYSKTFAEICSHLHKMKVDVDEGHVVTFKSLLLNRCQKMFETPLKDQLIQVGSEWDAKASAEKNEATRRLFENDRDEQIKKAKDKYYGNIRFIGELFLKNLLAGRVIHCCIETLLQNKEEESLHSLCKLLETTGEHLDKNPRAQEKQMMNKYFDTIAELVKSGDMESRIKYKLMDIIDMRSRNWLLREIQEQQKIKPMTKGELEEDEKRKNQERFQEPKRVTKSSSMLDNKKRPNPPTPLRPQIVKQPQLETHKMTMSVPSDTVTLGPGLGHSMWTRGSGVNKNEKKQDNKGSLARSSSSLINSRETSRSRDASPKASTPLESSPRSLTPSSIPPKAATPVLSTEELKDKVANTARHIIGEYMSVANIDEEACKHIEMHGELFVAELFNYMLDHDRKTRECVGDLFYQMITRRLLSPGQLVNGFRSVAESADDLVLDIPDLWLFFAECFHMMVHRSSPNLDFFAEVLAPLPPRPTALVLAHILRLAAKRLDEPTVANAFASSGIHWSKFLETSNPSDIDDFLEAHHITFTRSVDPKKVVSEISSALLKPQLDNDFLFSLFDQVTLPQSEFIGEVAWLVIKTCVDESKKHLKDEEMKEKSVFLTYIVDNNAQREFDVLCSVQKHFTFFLSSQVLCDLFEHLLLLNVISADGFEAWKDSSHAQSSLYYRDIVSACSNFFTKTLTLPRASS